jgi:hypothetical protein
MRSLFASALALLLIRPFPESAVSRAEGTAVCAPMAAAAGLFLPGKPDIVATRLFTPPAAAGTSCVVRSALSIDALARDYARREPGSPFGAWRVSPSPPLDAFDAAARFDRHRLARLYGSRRPLIARGPIERNGRIVASLTLIAPYPDTALSKLLPGTMVIVFWIPAES